MKTRQGDAVLISLKHATFKLLKPNTADVRATIVLQVATVVGDVVVVAAAAWREEARRS